MKEWRKISIDEYLEIDAVRSGQLNDILRSPAHMKSKRVQVTKAMMDGSLFHKAILEPEDFDRCAVNPPQEKKGRKGNPSPEWENFLNECEKKNLLKIPAEEIFTMSVTLWETFFNNDAIVVDDDSRKRLCAIMDVIDKYPKVLELINGAEKELTAIIKVDSRFGDFLVKTRPDCVGKDYIADLKFTTDASRFRPIDSGYHIQSVLQMSLAQMINPEIKNYYWIVIEAQPPHGIIIYNYSFPSEFHEYSIRKLTDALKKYGECLKTGTWEGYPQEIIEVEVPRWAN